MGDQYITNPSAQQGAPTEREGAVKSANTPTDAKPLGGRRDQPKEGPVEIPEHANNKIKGSTDSLAKPRGSLGEKIGR